MSETKNPGEKKLTLSLKPRTETGVVRQSFSHGRSKQVVVEKIKRRSVGGTAEAKPEPAPVAAPKKKAAAPKAAAPAAAPAEAPKPSGVVLRTLTEEERVARAHALADSRVREAEERKIAEEESRRRKSREGIDKTERDAADLRKREEDDRRKHDEETKKKADEVAKKRFGEEEAKRSGPGARLTLEADEDEPPRVSRRPGGGAARPAAARPTTPRAGVEKQRGRLTLVTALRADEVRERSVASFRRRTQRLKGHASNEPKEKLVREVTIPEAITISDLANRMSERAVDVIRLLMAQGQMLQINDVIDADTAQLIAEEMGHSVRRVAEADVEEGLFDKVDETEATAPRAPVVTVMGHVDHGKTSLLDAIRSTDVVAGEAGGITQHIGAYQVTAPSGAKITFIDTPGHAAFTAMRARGAKVTDIVVLVVAADDGVMPQTIEAIHHAKAAKVPIIVAINKIDKPDAKPDRVRTELLQHEIQVESLGGEVVDVEVSATKKTNIDKLLEMLGLQAEILDLKANTDRPAEGTVIEAKLDRGRGPVATVLVQRGTLRVGDLVVAGAEWGRVRALVSDTGEPIEAAGPSMPVEVLGFSGTPDAGDRLAVVDNEARAREVTAYRGRQKREKTATRATGMRGSLEQMMAQAKTSGRKEFSLVIKADVQGSLEAIIGALDKMATDEVAARVLHAGVGGISGSDVTLAEASGVPIIAFNVRANKEAREAAERVGIEIRYYNIIYDLVDDVKKAMSGLLAPTLRETMLGNAQILEIFKVSKVGNIAGCRVTDGTVERGANVRLIRDNVVIHEGKLSQLKRFKDDAKEVPAGQECGMAFENYQDMRAGDVIECYRVETIQRSL
ncbi:MAG: translation initiation factor IF-2 [Pseudolabrys sp.]|nr:translation initiation factor IF-2 [Pseudolabrys sp.]